MDFDIGDFSNEQTQGYRCRMYDGRQTIGGVDRIVSRLQLDSALQTTKTDWPSEKDNQ